MYTLGSRCNYYIMPFTAGYFSLVAISSFFKTKKGWQIGVVAQNRSALIAVVSPKFPSENSVLVE